MNLFDAYTATRPAEVTFDAQVTGRAQFFYGTHTHCEHEAFDVRSAAGPIRVIDNVALAPRVPVQPGDQVRIRGVMVHDAGKPPVVHWTHHDPAGRHPDGFIDLHGRVYA